MSIASFYTQTATVERLTPRIANPDISEYISAGTISCHVQQVSAEEAAFVEGVFGKTFRLWCAPSTNIKETDRITIGGRKYTIRGIKTLTTVNPAINKHLEIMIVEDLS